ncbi:MAG: FtsX-like permease family protein [Spirochaetaceae bacterium]|jgi:ABC-type lipoprotein release transport system permease subunit|nr:FtsX-like permease family protein [Spirochaetaceae bacterium]
MYISEAFKLSYKYLIRYRRRYLFLFAALSFGFCIVTVIISIKDGMERNVYFSAQGHYAGDLVISGSDEDSEINGHISNEYIKIINKAVKDTQIQPKKSVMRTQYFGDAAAFHNGETAVLKYLVGVDWQAESDYIAALLKQDAALSKTYASNPDVLKSDVYKNDVSGIDALGDTTILISEPIAQKIQARKGDSILVEIENRYGQKDTANFIVAGVFSDSSIFGFYKSFVSRTALNALAGFAEGECSIIGLYFSGSKAAETARQRLQAALEGRLQISKLAQTRGEWDAERSKDWSSIMIFLLTLPVYLTEITNILQSLNVLSFLLYIMMLIIIFVSAAVTYRLIFYERTKEIASMRAIGFYENDIVLILSLETALLATISLAAGFILALIASAALTSLPFNWFPGMDMFLSGGSLSSVYKPASVLFNALAIYVMLLPAVLLPARTFTRMPLPRMLAGSTKE